MHRSPVPWACALVTIACLATSCGDSSAADNRASSVAPASEQIVVPISAARDASTKLPAPAVALSSTGAPRNPTLGSASPGLFPKTEAVQHLNAGLRAWRQGRLEQAATELRRAVQDFDEAVRLNLHLDFVYAHRARALTLLDRDEEARRDVERAVALRFNRSHLEVEIAMLKRLR